MVNLFLNKENLQKFTRLNSAWAGVQEDIVLLEKYFGVELGPQGNGDFIHRNISSTTFYLWRARRPIAAEIMESGKIRRSLG